MSYCLISDANSQVDGMTLFFLISGIYQTPSSQMGYSPRKYFIDRLLRQVALFHPGCVSGRGYPRGTGVNQVLTEDIVLFSFPPAILGNSTVDASEGRSTSCDVEPASHCICREVVT